MAKPILDALKGIVFAGDTQVVELLVRKYNLTTSGRLVGLPPTVLDALVSETEFLHVVVERLMSSGEVS